MTNHPDQWLSIREASLLLDVSELTIRRRLKDGRLAHRLDNGKYYVNLGLPLPERDGQDDEQASPPSTPLALESATREAAEIPGPTVDLTAVLQDYGRLAEQAGRATVLQEQLRELEERYAALQEGTVSLSNRNGWLESKLDEREQDIKLLSDSQHRKSWWRRLFS